MLLALARHGARPFLWRPACVPSVAAAQPGSPPDPIAVLAAAKAARGGAARDALRSHDGKVAIRAGVWIERAAGRHAARTRPTPHPHRVDRGGRA